MTSLTAAQEPSPRKTYRLMAGMACAAILLLGVAIYSLSQLNQEQKASTLQPPTLTSTLRLDLPKFEFTSERKTLSPSNFQGQWTLLTFWAYWCAPCLEELPTLHHLSQQWSGPPFDILTVNLDKPGNESFEQAGQFLSDEGIAVPTVFDKEGVLKSAFNVNDLPRHFLINPEAKIVWQEKGAFKWDAPATRDQLIKIMEEETEKAEATAQPAQDQEQESEE